MEPAVRATAAGPTTQRRLLHDGLTVVIAGPPNAAKSSSLNALAGTDAAIITTNVAGFQAQNADMFVARRRHLDALERPRNYVEQGTAALEATRAGELLAEELRLA